jgi:poly(3-hydroxybutyrate) depolymerase
MERVRPADIKTTALLSVEGALDDISGSGQTQAVHDICSGVPKSEQVHFEAKGAGHYGIFSGRRWREHVYPVVKAFILSHHNQQAAAAVPVAKVVEVAPEPVATAHVAEAVVVVATPVKAIAKSAVKAPAKKSVKPALAPVAPAPIATKKVAAKRTPGKK